MATIAVASAVFVCQGVKSTAATAVLGIFLPLITTNCAVLGVALINVRQNQSFLDAIILGLGAALGFSLLIVTFSAIRLKQEGYRVPQPFQGAAINMISAGLISLAFLGFTGMNT